MNVTAIMMGGVPAANRALYHRIRFAVGDSAVFIQIVRDSNHPESILLVRDIEMDRARQLDRFDRVACSADFPAPGGLSGDRDTALAQAAAQCLRQHGVASVITDRSLPYIFAWHVRDAGIELQYDAELGVSERRTKNETELDHLRKAQSVTENAMEAACRLIARADVDDNGVLLHDGSPLTSERVRASISMFLLERGFSNHADSIVATLPHVADCHHFGTGPLHTGLPVIVDIFPRDNTTRYWGDCSRSVVNGRPSEALVRMHSAVVEAKAAAIAALKPGVTGQQVHEATAAVITRLGYAMGQPPADADDEFTSMRHGTGHGIGLDVHEPILLDTGGGEILAGEVFTVEPGLYSKRYGGVRVEDMVAVTDDGVENFNHLHEGLDWS